MRRMAVETAMSRVDPPGQLVEVKRENYLGSEADRGGVSMILLSRRQIIEAGAATGALAAMSSPLLAAVVDPLDARAPTALPICASTRSTVPARPRVAVDPFVDPADRRPRPRRVRPSPRPARPWRRRRHRRFHQGVRASRASICSTRTAAGSPATSSPTAAARTRRIPASCSVSPTRSARRRARTAPM